MDLTGIISISGKPGLYKIVAQSKSAVIVENIDDKKRFPAHSRHRISALEDISIYTYEEDLPLKEVYEKLYKHTDGKKAINHKEAPEKLRSEMDAFLPDYDEERVYDSDIKKLFQWFNLLHKAGLLEVKEEAEKKETKEAPKKAEKKEAKTESKTKKAPAKTAKKTSTAAKKKAPAKKAASTTTKKKTTGNKEK